MLCSADTDVAVATEGADERATARGFGIGAGGRFADCRNCSSASRAVIESLADADDE